MVSRRGLARVCVCARVCVRVCSDVYGLSTSEFVLPRVPYSLESSRAGLCHSTS
jgi:hypothetical protein